jgi:hypothetical protein
MPAHATHDTQARMADDIAQLTHPIHTAIRGRIITHPPLLDQLRNAATPSNGTSSRGPERRYPPNSQPAARLDPIDTLAAIYVAISAWHTRLQLPSPARQLDWQKAALRQFVGAAPNLAPSIADWLAIDTHDWWRDAAAHSGWRPADLLKLR